MKILNSAVNKCVSGCLAGLSFLVMGCHNNTDQQNAQVKPEPAPQTLNSDSLFSETSKALGRSSFRDDTLSGFMLAGVYFINGYDGIDATDRKAMKGIAVHDTARIINAYRGLFEFPFKKDDIAGSRIMLQDMWKVKNREELIRNLDSLQKSAGPHKAWNYALLVNYACIGYAADFLSREEVFKYVNTTLPLAKQQYRSWGDYYTDFVAGRKAQYPKDKLNPEYEAMARRIAAGEPSIFQILPLN